MIEIYLISSWQDCIHLDTRTALLSWRSRQETLAQGQAVTRAVALTDAGQRLQEKIGPHFDQIEVEIDALNQLRDKPSPAFAALVDALRHCE